jgi:hypothetical protein
MFISYLNLHDIMLCIKLEKYAVLYMCVKDIALYSMKKQAFWGQPSTQMLECGRNGKVSIKDQRPSQHESVSSSNCHYYRV